MSRKCGGADKNGYVNSMATFMWRKRTWSEREPHIVLPKK
jgi:hypothetical protein